MLSRHLETPHPCVRRSHRRVHCRSPLRGCRFSAAFDTVTGSITFGDASPKACAHADRAGLIQPCITFVCRTIAVIVECIAGFDTRCSWFNGALHVVATRITFGHAKDSAGANAHRAGLVKGIKVFIARSITIVVEPVACLFAGSASSALQTTLTPSPSQTVTPERRQAPTPTVHAAFTFA